MLPSTFSSAVALFTLGAGASGLYTVQPCRDSTCSSCDDTAFAVTSGYPTLDVWPALSESRYNGSKAWQNGTVQWPEQQVWLNVNQPDDKCQVVVYQMDIAYDYSGGRVGDTIFSTAHAGCFKTSMNSHRRWHTTYCCGDCSPALPVGAADIAAGPPQPNGLSPHLVGNTPGGHPSNATRATAKVTTSAGQTAMVTPTWASSTALPSSSATATIASKLKIRGQTWTKRGDRVDMCTDPLLEDTQHQFTCLNEPWTPSVSCGITPQPRAGQLGRYKLAGDQHIISSKQGCWSDKCLFESVSVGETLINLMSVADVESHGINVTMQAGMDLLKGGGPGVSASTSFSSAWTKSIADTAGISNFEVEPDHVPPPGEMAGTFGYQWFTGILDCEQMAITCNGMDLLLEKCSPSFFDGSTTDVAGWYGYTTIG